MFNLHYRLERKTIGLVLGIIGVAAIGGAVEFDVEHLDEISDGVGQ